MMKLYKIIFFNSMMLGTLISISSYSWLSMWMGLEINLLSIIPLFSSTKNIFSSESSLKYFITQALASLILLFSIIMMLSTTEFITKTLNPTLLILLNSALMTKLGAAPFHFWFPEVMEGLNWFNCLIMLTWQKIAPMILIMNNQFNNNFMVFIIMMSLIISTTMGFNQISLRKILTFSSINHIAWMISSMMISFTIWLIYFLIYSLITINIIIMFLYFNSFYMKQLINSFNNNKMLKFSFMVNFLSLGGLPPFIGFMPKWLTINWMINNNFYLLTFLLITLTLIMLYIYIRIIFTSLIMSYTENKTTNINPNKFLFYFTNFILITSLIMCTYLFNFL
uniref:NADH-ubiquinone oxidoreductase chain 2 n=1 Tax=Trictenotoma davidi TaxID=2813663 RepID=A0A8A3WL67_9CUCU|nr:NADH dehydrogenase subunit 2 [Trictenotoma davidi]QTA72345.1 NADH dehydrogenase subunit 2 [Trictenotoma davidi]